MFGAICTKCAPRRPETQVKSSSQSYQKIMSLPHQLPQVLLIIGTPIFTTLDNSLEVRRC
jgi:hypothetical protein